MKVSTRDIDVLARTLYGECRGESEQGKIAVAWVVRNRAEDPRRRYGRGIAGVCQKAFQFSCWNADDPNLPKLLRVDETDRAFAACLQVARDVLGDRTLDPTFGALHYATLPTNPPWAERKAPCVVIGNHKFWNNVD